MISSEGNETNAFGSEEEVLPQTSHYGCAGDATSTLTDSDNSLVILVAPQCPDEVARLSSLMSQSSLVVSSDSGMDVTSEQDHLRSGNGIVCNEESASLGPANKKPKIDGPMFTASFIEDQNDAAHRNDSSIIATKRISEYSESSDVQSTDSDAEEGSDTVVPETIEDGPVSSLVNAGEVNSDEGQFKLSKYQKKKQKKEEKRAARRARSGPTWVSNSGPNPSVSNIDHHNQHHNESSTISEEPTLPGKALREMKTRSKNNSETVKPLISIANLRTRSADKVADNTTMDICFVAILSPDFGFKRGQDHVYIICGHELLGGWNEAFTEMLVVDYNELDNRDAPVLLAQHVYVPKALFSRNNFLEYKYMINKNGEDHWEYLPSKHHSSSVIHERDRHVNRCLRLDDCSLAFGHYMRLDGCIMPEKTIIELSSRSTGFFGQAKKTLQSFFRFVDDTSSQVLSMRERRTRDAVAGAEMLLPQFYPQDGFHYLPTATNEDGQPLEFKQVFECCTQIAAVLRLQLPEEDLTNTLMAEFVVKWVEQAYMHRDAMPMKVRITVGLVALSMLFNRVNSEATTNVKIAKGVAIECFLHLCALFEVESFEGKHSDDSITFAKQIYSSLTDKQKILFDSKFWALINLCKDSLAVLSVMLMYWTVCEDQPLQRKPTSIAQLFGDSKSWYMLTWPSYADTSHKKTAFRNDLLTMAGARSVTSFLQVCPRMHAVFLREFCEKFEHLAAYSELYPSCPVELLIARFGLTVRNYDMGSYGNFNKLALDVCSMCLNRLVECIATEEKKLLLDFQYLAEFVLCFKDHSRRSVVRSDIYVVTSLVETWTLLICRLVDILLAYNSLERSPRHIQRFIDPFSDTASLYLQKLSDALHHVSSHEEVAQNWIRLLMVTSEFSNEVSETWMRLTCEEIKKFYGKNDELYLKFLANLKGPQPQEKITSFWNTELTRLLKSLLTKGNTGFLSSWFDKTPMVARVISETVINQWPKGSSGDSLLAYIVDDPMTNALLRYFGAKESNQADMQKLLDACRKHLVDAKALLNTTLAQCNTNQISLARLDIICDRQKNFLMVACSSMSDQELMTDKLTMMRDIRLFFKKLSNDLKCWTQMFSIYKEKFSDAKLIFDLCSKGDETITIEYILEAKKQSYGLPADFLLVVPRFRSLKDCGLFRNVIYGKLTEESNSGARAISLTKFVQTLYDPAVDRITKLIQDILSGNIKLSEVDSLLAATTRAELCSDLTIWNREYNSAIPTTSLENRLQKMDDYVTLRRQQHAAEVLRNLKTTLGLEGDFKALEDLAGLKGQQDVTTPQFLSDISDTMIAASKVLEGFTPNMTAAIEAFLHAREFVDWVRGGSDLQNSERRQREVKTFIDIATPNAAASDEHFLLITNFSKVVAGYASLIYRLKADDGLRSLLMQLGDLWRSIEAEPKLPEMLISLNDSGLSKLKALWDTQGALEKTVTIELGQILRYGAYVVACAEGRINEELDDVLQVRLLNTSSSEEVKRLPELKDLLNKLMLIGSQMDRTICESIATFSQIHEAAASLGDLLLKHEQAGNTFFSNCEFVFYCATTSELCATVKFRSEGTELLGMQCDLCQSAVMHILELNRVLQNCLDSWQLYFVKMREKYPCLNYYTNSQIVFLQKQLHAVSKGVVDPDKSVLDPEVAMLLMDVKSNLCYGDVVKAFEDTVKLDDSAMARSKSWHEVLLQLEKLDPTLASTVHEKMQARLTPSAMEISETMEVDALQSDSSENFEFVWKSEVADAVLKRWHTYLSSQRRASSTDLLSVDVLGQLLTALEKMMAMEASLEAIQPPGWLQNQKTCFLVTPRESILQAALTVIMQATSQKTSLPRASEVLVCQPWTTTEKVQLFFARMSQCSVGRIYMLIDVDRLVPEVAEAVVKNMEIYLQHTRPTCLVVFCAKEGYECMIASYFARYSVSMPQYAGNWMDTCSFVQRAVRVPSPVDSRNYLAVFCSFYLCLVTSVGYGQGKTLCVNRLRQHMERVNSNFSYQKIPIHAKHVELHELTALLKPHARGPQFKQRRMLHLDIMNHLTTGVDSFIFQLLIGSIEDKYGYVWRRLGSDYYAIEISSSESAVSHAMGSVRDTEKLLRYALPMILCHDPTTSMNVMNDGGQLPSRNDTVHNSFHDSTVFKSSEFQRTAQYLIARENRKLDSFIYDVKVKIADAKVLATLLQFCQECGLLQPSWSELRHLSHFLNHQLLSAEDSHYCDANATKEELPGFRVFVVDFIVQMARDFATRTLKVSEEVVHLRNADFANLEDYKVVEKQHWEKKPHPYVFLNNDSQTYSFFGCMFNQEGDLLNPHAPTPLKARMITKLLLHSLVSQCICRREAPCTCGMREILTRRIDDWKRSDLLQVLHRVLGTGPDMEKFDPDPLYELTSDCVLKMLAIEMRFRAGIPVIIMGETGCGKTRLIQFLCSLKLAKVAVPEMQNMFVMKLHSGVSSAQVYAMIERAQQAAVGNSKEEVDTILFFDEANTSPLISLIKEIMVDQSFNGKPLNLHLQRVKVIAAVNPYRKHNENVLTKLKGAGLGYLEETNKKKLEKFGSIPLRHLVYRVHPLPPSMIPLVWDFGTLTDDTEAIYISRMVASSFKSTNDELQLPTAAQRVLVEVLAATQKFMREQQDECSFVSLRDIERVLSVLKWFYRRRTMLFQEMDQELRKINEENNIKSCDPVTRALVLALCVCYRCSLQETRDKFDTTVTRWFKSPLLLPHGTQSIGYEVDACQRVFLRGAQLEPNTAQNIALKENFFMMVIGVELRIPLFVIGRPGSSKTLAKSVLARSMQGRSSQSGFFKELKEAQVITFQCSPSSNAEGVEDVFRQCARTQKEWRGSLDTHVAVAVFDEIGLAEDSPELPLKALHGFLEEGCPITLNEQLQAYHKVAFIGISNWALDPANMNRGIFITRPLPTQEELVNTARAICSQESRWLERMEFLIVPLTIAYLKVYQAQKDKAEFYGLRDFYSTLKAIYDCTAAAQAPPSYEAILRAIMHNFSGKKPVEHEETPIRVFQQHLNKVLPLVDAVSPSVIELIEENLASSRSANCHESRYLLVLTENYVALSVLRRMQELHDAMIIVGSSFPADSSYAQLCRNINRIKVCMSSGRKVICLNLEDMYESLYELLNQSLIEFAGGRLVDLGLGTHRVKCRVHDDFKLLVVANYDYAQRRFPIALMNRLEKHYMSLTGDLTDEQTSVVTELHNWVDQFSAVTVATGKSTVIFSPQDCFVGYGKDIVALLVSEQQTSDRATITQRVKRSLLWTATPDALLRMTRSALDRDEDEKQFCWNTYFSEQNHAGIANALQWWRLQAKGHRGMLLLTTFGPLLSVEMQQVLTKSLDCNCTIMNLQKYSNEQHFINDVRKVLDDGLRTSQCLLMQCYPGDEFQRLIDCSRFRLEECFTLQEFAASQTFIALVISLPRVAGGCFTGFPGGMWQALHVDCLLGRELSYRELHDKPLSVLLERCSSPTDNELTVFSLKQLILQSAMVAGTMIVGWEELALDRIQLICHLLEHNERFWRMTVSRLIRLQKDKEENGYKRAGWIVEQACNATAVFETRTFAEALHDQAVRSLAPLLAGLFSILDSGFNLNCLEKSSNNIDIFLTLMEDANFLTLRYECDSDVFFEPSSNTRRAKEEFRLQCPLGRQAFQFPLSWIIFAKLNELLDGLHADERLSHDDIAERAYDALVFVPWAKKLMEGWSKIDAIKMYLSDYMSLVSLSTNVEFLQLCKEWIFEESGVTGANSPFGFLAIHLVGENLRTPIALLEQLCTVNPLLPRLLVENKKVLSKFKMKVTWAAADLLAEEIVQAEFKSLDEYRQWLSMLEGAVPLVAQLLEIDSPTQVSRRSIEQLRLRWQKAELALILLKDEKINAQRLGVPGAVLDWLESVDGVSTVTFLDQLHTFASSGELANYSAGVFVEVVKKFLLYTGVAVEVVEKLCRDYIVGQAWSESTAIRAFLLGQVFRFCGSTEQSQPVTLLNAALANCVSTATEKMQQQLTATLLLYFDDCLANLVTEDMRSFLPHVSGNLMKTILVETALNQPTNSALTVKQVEAVARMRLLLCNVAANAESSSQSRVPERDIVDSVVKIFLEKYRESRNDDNGPHRFLVRRLNQLGGLDLLKAISNDSSRNWLIDEQMRIGGEESPDLMLVYGIDYAEVKTQMNKAVSENKLTELMQRLEHTRAFVDEKGPVFTTLAMYSLKEKFIGNQSSLRFTELSSKLIPFLNNSSVRETGQLISRPFMQQLENMLLGEPQLMRFVAHLVSAIYAFPRASLFLFFSALLNDPRSVRTWYFPAMPMNAINEMQQFITTQGQAPTIYACPQGHPYLVGECGRPMQQARCYTCGYPIGGQNHTLTAGNERFNAAQHPERGYCYQRMHSDLMTERQLTRLGTVAIRMILQGILMGAAMIGKELINVITVPNIPKNDPFAFLRTHWDYDMIQLRKELNRNADECFIFLHLLLKQMITVHGDIASLADPNGRLAWESVFLEHVLTRVRGALERDVKAVQTAVSKEKEDAILFRVLFREHNASPLWTDYHPTTLGSLLGALRRQLDMCRKKDHVVLQKFVEQEAQLCAIRFLPKVFKLLELLCSHYRCFVDVHDVHTLTIEEFLNSLSVVEKKSYMDLFENYFHAWTVLRDFVEKRVFLLLPPESHGSTRLPLPAESVPVLQNWRLNPVAVCLPLPCRMGLAACALASSLIALQNDFAEIIRTQLFYRNRQAEQRTVDPTKVTNNELISFDPETDLRSAMLMAREVNADTGQVEFNLGALERRLEQRILHDGVRLQLTMPQVKPKQQRTAHGLTLLQTNESIAQTELPTHVQHELIRMCEYTKRLSDVKYLLSVVELVVGFASSLSNASHEQQNLHTFVVRSLQLKDIPPIVEKVLKACDLRHVIHLWQFATFQRRFLLFDNQQAKSITQDVFLELPDEFRQQLPKDLKRQLAKAFQTTNLLRFLVCMTELLVLHLHDANPEEMKLKSSHPLITYLEDKLIQAEWSFMQEWSDVVPDEVELGCAIDVWNLAASKFKENYSV